MLSFKADHKERLDKLVARRIVTESRAQVQLAIKMQKISVNSQIILECDYKVSPGDLVEYHGRMEHVTAQPITPKQRNLVIVYEDEDIAVIDKPHGLTVHPGAGNSSDTLVNALLSKYGSSLSDIGGPLRPGIVHRLDKDTSGLMLIAKNNNAHQSLAMQLAVRTIKKRYWTLVYGVCHPMYSTICTNIGRSTRDRTKMAVLHNKGKHAVTHYKTLNVYGAQALSLLECQLETGRTHQIRVHLSNKRNHLVGDNAYSGGYNHNLAGLPDHIAALVKNFPRQALHSQYIQFIHPSTQETLSFEITLPKDLQNLVDALKNYGTLQPRHQ